MRDQQSSLRSFLWVRKANAGKQGESKCDFLAFLTGKFPSEILSCPPRLGDLPARNVAKGIAQKSGASAERNRQLRQSYNDQITFQQRKNILGVIFIETILLLNHIFNWIDLFWKRKYCIQTRRKDNGQPLCISCVADVFVIVLLFLLLLSDVQKMLHPARREERSGGPLTTIRGACSGITGRENQQSVQIT